jgi:hypothetical protein
VQRLVFDMGVKLTFVIDLVKDGRKVKRVKRREPVTHHTARRIPNHKLHMNIEFHMYPPLHSQSILYTDIQKKIRRADRSISYVSVLPMDANSEDNAERRARGTGYGHGFIYIHRARGGRKKRVKK